MVKRYYDRCLCIPPISNDVCLNKQNQTNFDSKLLKREHKLEQKNKEFKMKRRKSNIS